MVEEGLRKKPITKINLIFMILQVAKYIPLLFNGLSRISFSSSTGFVKFNLFIGDWGNFLLFKNSQKNI
jgi:hypothetical protein